MLSSATFPCWQDHPRTSRPCLRAYFTFYRLVTVITARCALTGPADITANATDNTHIRSHAHILKPSYPVSVELARACPPSKALLQSRRNKKGPQVGALSKFD